MINLEIGTANLDLLFVWNHTIAFKELEHKKRFDFKDCNEIWFENSKYVDNQVDSLLSVLGGIDQILSNRSFAKLEYSHHLLTFCSDYMIKNPKIGFTRLVYQKMVEGGSRVDTTLESKYILLNQLVYLDLRDKSFIDKDDTVYLVNRKTEKVRRTRMLSEEVQNYISYWN